MPVYDDSMFWFYLLVLIILKAWENICVLRISQFFSSNKCDKISLCHVSVFKNKHLAVDYCGLFHSLFLFVLPL